MKEKGQAARATLEPGAQENHRAVHRRADEKRKNMTNTGRMERKTGEEKDTRK
jgi:hypothetical protein